MFGNGNSARTERAIRELQTAIVARMDQSHREVSERMDRIHADLAGAIGSLEQEQAVTRTKLDLEIGRLARAKAKHELQLEGLTSWRHRVAERLAIGGGSVAALYLSLKDRLGL